MIELFEDKLYDANLGQISTAVAQYRMGTIFPVKTFCFLKLLDGLY